jgi:hypothetical protein
MGAVTLAGSITGGPPSGGSSFPGSTFNDQIAFPSGPRSFSAATGMIQRSINSPSAFVPLGGVGPTGDVTTADFLYLVTNGSLDVRITAQNGSGGFTTAVVSVANGPLILPVSPNKLITLVEVQGSATIEYLASGPG